MIASPAPPRQRTIVVHRPQGMPCPGLGWLLFVLLGGLLIFCHGCHGDEDDELFTSAAARHSAKSIENHPQSAILSRQ